MNDRHTHNQTATPVDTRGEIKAESESAPRIREDVDLHASLHAELNTDLAALLQVDDATLNILISSGC